jgi:hypothetical protein
MAAYRHQVSRVREILGEEAFAAAWAAGRAMALDQTKDRQFPDMKDTRRDHSAQAVSKGGPDHVAPGAAH